jgi:hypothetical protein
MSTEQYVMIPNEDDIMKAKKLIDMVYEGEILTEDIIENLDTNSSKNNNTSNSNKNTQKETTKKN